jgi:hypothetical protein
MRRSPGARSGSVVRHRGLRLAAVPARCRASGGGQSSRSWRRWQRRACAFRRASVVDHHGERISGEHRVSVDHRSLWSGRHSVWFSVGHQPEHRRSPRSRFRPNGGDLWIVGAGGQGDTGMGMLPGTSPSLDGSHVAFQANTRALWGDRGIQGVRAVTDVDFMAVGTSLSVNANDVVAAQLSNIYEVNGDLVVGQMATEDDSSTLRPTRSYR